MPSAVSEAITAPKQAVYYGLLVLVVAIAILIILENNRRAQAVSVNSSVPAAVDKPKAVASNLQASAASTDDSSDSTSTSAGKTSNTSNTSVTINGQNVAVPANGVVDQDVTDDNGNTHVHVDSQHSSSGGTNNSDVNFNIHSP